MESKSLSIYENLDLLEELICAAISNPDVEEHMGRVENCFNEIRKELRAMRKGASKYNK